MVLLTMTRPYLPITIVNWRAWLFCVTQQKQPLETIWSEQALSKNTWTNHSSFSVYHLLTSTNQINRSTEPVSKWSSCHCHSREEQKCLFHQDKPLVLFFALFSMKKYWPVPRLTYAVAAFKQTSLGATIVISNEQPLCLLLSCLNHSCSCLSPIGH